VGTSFGCRYATRKKMISAATAIQTSTVIFVSQTPPSPSNEGG
jgi:hypothetical protein